MRFDPFRALRRHGVLGINRRNIDFVARYNPRRLYPLVDDKVRTKVLAMEHGIPVPRLYGRVEAHGDLRWLPTLLDPLEDFVVKPAHGAMGNGVLVIVGREGERFVKGSGATLETRDLRYHVGGILSGLYSLGGRSDQALLEHRVRIHPAFRDLCWRGVPDCRVIVFKGVPVMSMLRLPTQMSDGRANLHQGAVAVGVDLSDGRTHCAVHLDRLIGQHPDTGETLRGRSVPDWDTVLDIAAASADMTGLGYLGVDVVHDAELGPMLLELNARPGLSIQLANATGLLPLLERIEALGPAPPDRRERIALAKELFSEYLSARPAAIESDDSSNG